MGIVLFFLLAVIAFAAILQPLLPGSHSTYPMPAVPVGRGLGRRPRPAGIERPIADQPGLPCPRCGAHTQAGDQFCVRCGESLTKIAAMSQCAACGSPLSEGDRFCRKCGASVTLKEAE